MVHTNRLLATGAGVLLWGSLLAVQAITVDHTCTDLTRIPGDAIAAAAAQRLVVQHASVGANINDGLDALQSDQPACDRSAWDFPDRGNPGWQEKVDGLVRFVGANPDRYDIFTMKLCYIDTDADWAYYRDHMLQLEADHPSRRFIWWTMPIMTSGSAERDAFNHEVRTYCEAHDRLLFDIADIEAHDPAGNHLMDGPYERLYNGYSSDGGHLNDGGSRRVAAALWWLMARAAGWDGTSADPWLDSDDDGVSDAHEETDGTLPNDPTSFVLRELAAIKLSGTVKLTAANRDAGALSAVLPGVAAGIAPVGAHLSVDLGGATLAFVLNAKGQGQSADCKAALKLKLARPGTAGAGTFVGGDVPLKISLKRGDWAAAWAAAGIDTAVDARNAPATLPVTLRFGGYRYGAAVPVTYSAKAGVSARFAN